MLHQVVCPAAVYYTVPFGAPLLAVHTLQFLLEILMDVAVPASFLPPGVIFALLLLEPSVI